MIFQACSLLNEVGEPPFFYISDMSNSSTLSGKSLRKKSMLCLRRKKKRRHEKVNQGNLAIETFCKFSRHLRSWIRVVFLFQKNASSCEKSCVFLAQLQNVSSLLAGDGFFPPQPGIPTITSRNFTSVSLKWEPVQNASGPVVYLVEITFAGEGSRVSSKYLSEVTRPDIIFKSTSLLSLFLSSSKTSLDYVFYSFFFQFLEH